MGREALERMKKLKTTDQKNPETEETPLGFEISLRK